jgi:hypothetical protein
MKTNPVLPVAVGTLVCAASCLLADEPVAAPTAADKALVSTALSSSTAVSLAQPAPAPTNSPPRVQFFVRPSENPSEGNRVGLIQEGRTITELDATAIARELGPKRSVLKDRLPESIADQGGIVRSLIRAPTPRTFLHFLNPFAPRDTGNELREGLWRDPIRGTVPLPHSFNEPIWFEPVGIKAIGAGF